jgi:hypothetical protein
MVPSGWSNALGTTYALPRWAWAPRSAGEVIEAVHRATAEGHRVRMTGNGHSFSDVAVNEDWLLSPRGLQRILDIDAASLRQGVNPSMLVRVQAGVSIHALNRALGLRGLALENMGGAEVQTFIGAASTGTHGSGLAFGPLASQIVALQVVGADGRLVQVEPSDGITEPSRFSESLPELPSVPIALEQNDQTFRALTVGLGCLGIVYAAIVRVVPKYWLVERRTMTTWEFLAAPGGVVDCLMAKAPIWPAVPDKSPLPSGSCLPPSGSEPDHVEVYYTPYAAADGTHAALLTQRWRVPCKPPGVGEPRGSLLYTPGTDLSVLFDKLGLLSRLYPNKTADVRQFHVFQLEQLAQRYYANISYDVFSIGALNDLSAYGVEPAFDLCQTKDAVLQNCRLAEQFGVEGIHHTAPVSLRFVKAADAYLAMQQGRDTTAMEMDVFAGMYGVEDLLQTNERHFITTLGARPHWGLDRNALRDEREVASVFPGWDKWKDVYSLRNRSGVFDGRVTDRLGISCRGDPPVCR